MTELDRASLDRLLPATAGPADWNDVLTRSGTQQRRHRLVVALVTVVVVAIGAASALAVRAIVFDGGGVTALPPEGATPSVPEKGKLVLSFYGRPAVRLAGYPGLIQGPGLFRHWDRPVNQVWIYADGRMIWRRESGPAGVGAVRTGFVERLLTPEGVRKLLSTFVATGLFDRARSLQSGHGLWWGSIRVRNGERLVKVGWGGSGPQDHSGAIPSEEQARELLRLVKLIVPPLSWLPASAWKEREPRGYVPPRYAICYTSGRARRLDPSDVLGSLPSAARDLLRGRARRLGPSWAGACSEVTIDEARTLHRILSAAGFERDPGSPRTYGDGVAENSRFQAPAPMRWLVISFEPILPHGQWEAMGG